MTVIEAPLRALTKDSFSRFGRVIEAAGADAVFDGPNRMRNLSFEADGAPELYLIRYVARDLVAKEFERHNTMTEARINLSGPSILVVAENDSLDGEAAPQDADMHAFLIAKGQGIIFQRGVWHGIDAFPVGQDFADFAFLTEAESERELEGPLDQCIRSEIINLQERFMLEVAISDPDGLTDGFVDATPGIRYERSSP